MDLKSELTRCMERREQFHIRLDNRPLQACEEAGRWMDILPIMLDPELGRSAVLYRKRMPKAASPWTASSFEDAMREAQRIMEALND